MLKSVTAIEASLYCIIYCWEDTGQILLTCLHEYLDQTEILPVSQCGFRKDRRLIGMTLSIQPGISNRNIKNMTFVDSFKAFVTLSRVRLWKIITMFGCPAKFIAVVWQFIEACLHDSRTIESTLNCFL